MDRDEMNRNRKQSRDRERDRNPDRRQDRNPDRRQGRNPDRSRRRPPDRERDRMSDAERNKRQKLRRAKEKKKQKKRELRQRRLRRLAAVIKLILKILLVLVIIAAIAFVYIKSSYKLKNIEVTGTDHYTDAEMVDIVTGGKSYGNTLLFIAESRLHPAENITFIDKIDVEYVDRNSVNITVYEKAMAGCMEYNGQYAYFDGDGIVLELSDEKLDDVPCIEGLSSDDVEQGKKLAVGDDGLFQKILTMTQLIYKNDIAVDRITYDENQELILHKGDIQIKLGSSGNMESKLMNLDTILSKLEGRKGTLDMSNYTEASGNAIFRENK